MEKVHILRWSSGDGVVGVYAVYLDYEKACNIAENSNKKRAWYHRILGDKWVVQTFDVKN